MKRITPGTLTLAIVAVVFSVAATYGLRQYLRQPVAKRPEVRPDETRVPVASIDLPEGRTITQGDIGLVLRRDMARVPDNSMLTPGDIVGRVLNKPLKSGDTFVTTHLYPQGLGPRVSEKLEPGRRAVTIELTDQEAVARHVHPDMLVDVVFRSAAKMNRQNEEEIPEMTVTLLESVRVLAIGSDPAKRQNAPRGVAEQPKLFVTLACSGEEATKLRAAQGRGELSLAIRADKESHFTSTAEPVTLNKVLGVAPHKPHTTEIYRGNQRSVSRFDGKQMRVDPPAVDRPGQQVDRPVQQSVSVPVTVAKPSP